MSENDNDGSGCNPAPLVLRSFGPLFLSVVFNRFFALGLCMVSSYFYQLKSPVEPVLLQYKILYHPFYLLIHNFKFVSKYLQVFIKFL